MTRSFLWGSSQERKKIHIVNWEVVCQPKLNGGLGLRHLRDTNGMFMAKVG